MIQKVETIAKIELLGLPLTADARERSAEYAEVTAISSDSEVHFVSLSSAMAADDKRRGTPNPQPLPPVVTGEGEQMQAVL